MIFKNRSDLDDAIKMVEEMKATTENEFIKSVYDEMLFELHKGDLENIVNSLIQKEKISSNVTMKHFEQAQKKVHPMMNERLREYYQKIQQHFKGGLPKQVQPPEYQ